MQTATTLLIPDEHEQRAVYVLEGEAQLEGEALEVQSLVVLPAGQEMTLCAGSDCHLVVFGGAPLDGPRRINWNFVASDPLKIEQARQRWAAGDWPTVPGETERIELPLR
jgi:redox-sensitive bicupin YhaK (pirin superfamily)